jgi:AcrR family transcriptional regulator
LDKEVKAKKEKKEEAKRRIFKAALSLMARKGFDAVGIREIARAAQVNISMINYYYGGKVGILKAIIDEMSEKYDSVILETAGENLTPHEQVHHIVHHLINFFRNNTELAIVTFNTFLVDLPEIIDARLKWTANRRTFLNQLYTQLGLNAGDVEMMSVIRGLLTMVIYNHFQSDYIFQFTKQAYKKSKFLSDELKEEAELECTDAYYERFAHVLTTVYLQGICGLTRNEKEKKEEPCTT